MIIIYNILIVDDEELICMGLKSMVERSGLESIKKVSFTSEPLKVQEMIEQLSINIIITDIMMPSMTGLDLIKSISEINSNIKFIVLSGYDDFKYVKEAFKLGAYDYLLKPGSMEELTAVLVKTIGIIREEEEFKLNAQTNRHKYMEAVLENRLNKIFSGSKTKTENIDALFNELNIHFQYDNFSIGIVAFCNNLSDGKNNEIMRMCLDKVGESILDKKELAIFYFYDFNNNLVFIFNYTSKVGLEKLSKYLNELMLLLKDCTSLDCIAALSGTETNMEGIVSCYSQALEALTYRLLYDYNYVIKFLDIKDKENSTRNFNVQLDKIKEFLSTYNTTALSDLIDSLFSRTSIQKLSMQSANKLYNRIITRIKDAADDNKVAFLSEEFREFASFNQLSDLKIYLKKLCFEVIKLLKEKDTDKSVSDIVKKYVKENYHKDIDMAVVSNMVSFSYSHFSKMFKDETGMNFSDYLLKVRMEKALEMLSNPVNRIQDIAQKVGYENPKHFTRAFKNHFGFSPSEYKGNL